VRILPNVPRAERWNAKYFGFNCASYKIFCIRLRTGATKSFRFLAQLKHHPRAYNLFFVRPQHYLLLSRPPPHLHLFPCNADRVLAFFLTTTSTSPRLLSNLDSRLDLDICVYFDSGLELNSRLDLEKGNNGRVTAVYAPPSHLICIRPLNWLERVLRPRSKLSRSRPLSQSRRPLIESFLRRILKSSAPLSETFSHPANLISTSPEGRRFDALGAFFVGFVYLFWMACMYPKTS
jgi:hypothetical protein